ncbi:hypothetical protein Taro_030898, partial [Colocasia esculenta]|nr:hypothetical protein [Colocasia esculenta]
FIWLLILRLSLSLSLSRQCLSPRDQPAYVTVELGKETVAETTHERDRTWNQTFMVLCAHPADAVLVVTLRTSRSSTLGRTSIPASRLLEDPGGGEPTCLDGSSFPLLTEKGRPNPKLKLRFLLRFERADLEPRWGRGLGDGGFGGLVDGVLFPQRSDCDVTLYQDAHHRRSFLPPVGGRCGGEQVGLRPRRLWEDVYRAIDGAKHLVYIAGWSFNPNLVLVRDPESELEHAVGVKLGDLLKSKAEQGVAVRVMLWDDETSIHHLHSEGLMRTHDEQTADFFRHTRVDCRLCPRHHHLLSSFFTHHQKTISVDSPAGHFSSRRPHRHHGPSGYDISDGGGGGLREIISFVGGLDLYDGRYDTEEHSLFRTLDAGGAHAIDFYQTSIPRADLHHGGPREPWHDTHARIAGAAAYDVLANFEQRWSKQCDPSSLVAIHTIPEILLAESALAGAGEDGWNVQVFRSIDGHSTDHLPGDLPVECSIHEAYVRAIRRAERFIYIENQYFFGGCQHWEQDRHCGCTNLIPVEIALKVASKIRAGERFAAYIVIPMWPEGAPDGEAVQAMLHWARLTVAMMYRLVGKAIRESGGGGHPRDYLSLFCLANREEKRGDELAPAAAPPRGTQYWNAQQNRRFMIYVHSKLMIVDDEYLLIGSANVNQRSMDGRRDTEIAVGCHQPGYVGEQRVAGDVHTYRLSLWYEHTGAALEVFREPQGVECARQLNGIADAAWGAYSGEAVADMEGVHLVSYPIAVSADGAVGDLEQGGGVFPDTSAAVKGRSSWVLPTVVTT